MQTNTFVSSEISSLWQAYLSSTMSHCMFRCFHQTMDDPDGKVLLTRVIDLQNENISWMKKLFSSENIPIPRGFTEEDINPQAAKLFTDSFIFQFLAFANQVAIAESSVALSTAPNQEIRSLFIKRLSDYTQLEDATFRALLEKGLFVRAPYVPYPKEVQFATDTSFLGGLFGNKKPLNVFEINHLFINSLRNQLGELLLTGFIQTTQNSEIREYLLKGKQLSAEISGIFNDVMKEAELPPVALVSVGVTDSTDPPFSDRLILNQVTALIQFGLGVYGFSLAQTSRADLGAQLTRIAGQTTKYGSEGVQLLVKLGYLESIPTAPDREELAKQK